MTTSALVGTGSLPLLNASSGVMLLTETCVSRPDCFS
jgi:hypothetical protein